MAGLNRAINAGSTFYGAQGGKSVERLPSGERIETRARAKQRPAASWTRRMLVDELLQPALLQVGGSVQARGFAFRHQNRRSARGSQFVLQG